jgi:hypothetical protein
VKPPQPAALAHEAGLCEREQARHDVLGQLPLLAGEVVDELCSIVVVLAHVVVVE